MSTLKTPVGEHDHIQGDPNAPATLLEYGDFQCPHCAAAHPMIQQLQERFGEQLRFVFRNFPLNRIASWPSSLKREKKSQQPKPSL